MPHKPPKYAVYFRCWGDEHWSTNVFYTYKLVDVKRFLQDMRLDVAEFHIITVDKAGARSGCETIEEIARKPKSFAAD